MVQLKATDSIRELLPQNPRLPFVPTLPLLPQKHPFSLQANVSQVAKWSRPDIKFKLAAAGAKWRHHAHGGIPWGMLTLHSLLRLPEDVRVEQHIIPVPIDDDDAALGVEDTTIRQAEITHST